MSDDQQRIYVWDRVVRLFHWSLVISFVVMYVTSQSGMQVLHSYIGYFVAAILLVRLLWGFTGSRYARFCSFLYPVREVRRYVTSVLRGTPLHYTGHNPAGALMVYAILLVMLGLIATGFITLATIEFEGPLVSLLNDISDDAAYFFQDLHHFLVDVMWIFISLHILGVITASIQHQENLVKAMISGWKTAERL